MLAPFAIHEPGSVAEACQMLATYGDTAAFYAGGTELIVIMKERLVAYEHLINLKTIPGLNAINIEGNYLNIGALCTHGQIERSALVAEHSPVVAQVAALVANRRVRSAGTIGGNLCFAEPHSDPATLLIALDANVMLTSDRGTRSLALSSFFTGLLETARRADEVLTSISIPLPTAHGVTYERFKTHERPAAAVAVAMRMDGPVVADARVVVGSVSAVPRRIIAAESLLIGEVPAAMIRAQAARLAKDEVVPTEDHFESVEYKRHLVEVLASRALKGATSLARGVQA